MSRAGIVFIAIIWFIAGCFAAFLSLQFFSSKVEPIVSSFVGASNLTRSSIDSYNADGAIPVQIQSLAKNSDARAIIVDNFLKKNASPMYGKGAIFVFMADKYGVDWKLLPAIAFQESNLGKKIPKNSYNAFGWAVYTGANSGVNFDSWEHAIETVAKGVKERYISKGLTTPEAIMTRYTPNSDGSWAFAVRFAMEEMVQ